ncbi:MAG: B12-binding domain-containing radical SAM protein, partial [Actinobacteria bacterium]|nr:B12-binding domain-containing radical SAM protein [Actinomycetota bacterium]
MRVLLFQAPASMLSPHARLSPPLGLAYVAQYLLDQGHEVQIVDLNVTGLNPARIRGTLNRVRPQLVGISSHTETYPNALALARLVKEFDPELPVLFGGPHASILPLEVLAQPDVDYVAVGEGELTAAELLQALDGGVRLAAIALIAGLGHKVRGVPKLNATREPLDAALIGRPARRLLSLEFYEDAFNVLAARGGCPYRCPFCSASYLWGGHRRMRPVGDVLAEVAEVIRDYGAEHVFFVDDILTLDRVWLGELMDAIEALGGGFTWGCATRVDCVDDTMLRRMSATGCTGIQFGIESGAQDILDSVKGIRKADALAAVRCAVEAGINVACSFMIPFPDDTEETLAQTEAFMRQIREAGGKLLISYTTPFPGTMFYERAEELG